ncbi:MAG: Wzz/FepE/Etk N-terminal domain-containing protein, partial [Verrucomicrobiales bacterium]
MNLPVPFQARPDAEPLAFGGAVGEGAPLPLLDLGQLWKVFRRNAWILWICLGVSVAGGLAYALLATKIYSSTAVVYIELEGETVLNNKGVRNLDFAGLEILKSIENLLQGVDIASRVIDSEKLAEDPDFAPLSPEKRIQA